MFVFKNFKPNEQDSLNAWLMHSNIYHLANSDECLTNFQPPAKQTGWMFAISRSYYFLLVWAGVVVFCPVVPVSANGTANTCINFFPGFKAVNEMSGTWAGNMLCGKEGASPIEFIVSQKGNPIFRYITKSGSREVELTHTGQDIAFVPPGGGVSRIKVISLSIITNRITYSLQQSNESTSGGTLVQEKGEVVFDAMLSGSVLNLKLKMQTQSVLSQPGQVIPGDIESVECYAALRKS